MHGSIERFEQANATDDDLFRAGRQLATDLGRLPGFVAYVLLTGADGHLWL